MSSKNKDRFEAITADVAERLYKAKQLHGIDYPLLKSIAQELRQSINIGYKTVNDNNFDVADKNMRNALMRNIYVFSAAKTREELIQISELLTDKKGNLRPFSEFKDDVLALNDKYNQNYLSAEYNHAVVCAQQASQWIDIQKTKDTLPLLQFDATMDNRTTDTCKALDGVTLPVNDPFWDTYNLPLHFNERSVIRQLARGKITEKDTIAAPNIQPMFKNNIGKTGVVFPESHPYFDGSKKEGTYIKSAANANIPKEYREVFTKIKQKEKGDIWVSSMVSKEELKYNVSISKIIRPITDSDIAVLGTFKNRVSPDLSWKGAVADIKTPESETIYKGVYSSIYNSYTQLYKQLSANTKKEDLINTVIIDLSNYNTLNKKEVYSAINSFSHKTTQFKYVLIYKKKVIKIIKKNKAH